jgi:pimeloyl-ACP methyl ester carboxylesterase
MSDFLPPDVKLLTEATSIALAGSIQRQPIATPLSSEPIATAYVCEGTDQEHHTPILLLHGFDSSVFEFRRLLPLLAQHNPTWAVDLLGFGFTDRPVNLPFSPTAIKRHLYAFWQALIGQPVILVGASMGGAAAIDFALTYPQAVAKLVLIDSAGFTVGRSMGQFLVPPLGYLATRFLQSPKVRQQISVKAYHDPQFASVDAQQCAALHLQHPNWQQALIAFTRSGGYGSFRDKLADLEVPTLILWGSSDRILGTGDATKFAEAIADSKLVWIKQAGHVPHLEQPQATSEHILAFC